MWLLVNLVVEDVKVWWIIEWFLVCMDKCFVDVEDKEYVVLRRVFNCYV